MRSAKTCGGPSRRRFVGLYFKVDETNDLEIFTQRDMHSKTSTEPMTNARIK